MSHEKLSYNILLSPVMIKHMHDAFSIVRCIYIINRCKYSLHLSHTLHMLHFFSWKLVRECRVGFITLLGRRKCNINFCICIRRLRMITLHTCYIVFPSSLISTELLMILRQLLCSLLFYICL